jgi:3-hydroxyisobutyrate dehydrogenase
MAPMTAALRIGWIGTGVMGGPMAGHLLDRGHDVSVFNRTRSRTDALVEAGAQWRDSPAELAQGVDVVVTMLGTPADVRDTILGEGRVLECMREGTLLIDMTTSEPSLAVEIHEAARAAGVDALDAPVSGGDVGARNGTLVIMVGGDRQAFNRARQVFEPLGKTIELQGGPGAGQHTKMVNQTLIAGAMIGVCEALLYAYRAGLDLETVLQSVEPGAAGSWSLTNYAPRMLKGDFEPGFVVEHFVKDMGIALSEARQMNLSLPGLALVQQLYVALMAQGQGRKGTQSLILALSTLSGVEWRTASEPSAR